MALYNKIIKSFAGIYLVCMASGNFANTLASSDMDEIWKKEELMREIEIVNIAAQDYQLLKIKCNQNLRHFLNIFDNVNLSEFSDEEKLKFRKNASKNKFPECEKADNLERKINYYFAYRPEVGKMPSSSENISSLDAWKRIVRTYRK